MASEGFLLDLAGWDDFHRLLGPAIKDFMRWSGPR
jgi:hypothetical protein